MNVLKVALLTCVACGRRFESSGKSFCSERCENDKFFGMEAWTQRVRKAEKRNKKKREKIEKKKAPKAPRVRKKRLIALERENKLLRETLRAQKEKKFKEGFYTSRPWRALRYEALRVLGRKCQCCGATGKEMHVDHIKPRSLFPALELELSNLQILCADCNLGKSNKDQTDWRPGA